MPMIQNLICINCPMGCRLKVSADEKGEWIVEGNQCSRGKVYALKEMTAPTRVLTTTVKLKNSLYSRLPVRTSEGIPKGKLMEAMKVLNQIEVDAPVEMGEVVMKNLLGTNINVIATRSL